MEQLPLTIDVLIDELDAEIPEVNPNPKSNIQDLMFQAGRRSVVLYLKQLREQSRNP
jgi:hypothetical protein